MPEQIVRLLMIGHLQNQVEEEIVYFDVGVLVAELVDLQSKTVFS